MKKIKLLALDLDGTVLNDEGKVPAENREWILKAVDAGVTVMFSTGRGMQTVTGILSEIPLVGPMVLLNGAEVWGGKDELVERHYLDADEIRRLHSIAHQADAHFWGYCEESLTGKADWTEEMFGRSWMKFGMYHKDNDVIEELRRLAAESDTIEISRSAAINMEISPKGISKESGVRTICTRLGIGMDEVMAIGDNLNDYRLIKAAGLGVAMGNGDDELKAAADAVTETNNNAGVAKAIQRYIFEVA
ncbi:Cof-type HAD-IIB family hydrolase [Paenibacillus lemnae]|uniref:HAD family phosphatase n=1 Tax=Paenibacillus lemnae TaxID=1330551 RepID=A0A848M2C3_PAELE|nr:Cof-type HAD-IIB family hydrolase [Paenibacillus lemnae]NMO94419.1 HAD family phosphatase [Paenibacillus lemnae]